MVVFRAGKASICFVDLYGVIGQFRHPCNANAQIEKWNGGGDRERNALPVERG